MVQNAADALQKNLIVGLAAHWPSVSVVNLPFVGSYPRFFRKKVFPGTNESLLPNVNVLGQGFALRRLIKTPSRTVAAFKGVVRSDRERHAIILIYSAHLPFLIAALLYRMIFKKSRTCLILPDLPEFMGEGGRLYTIAKAIESRVFYVLVKRVDAFVVLTRFMAEKLGLEPGTFTVVEGIADDALAGEGPPPLPTRGRIFLYTGTLASRYGVMDLVNAFKAVRAPDAELWICGEGDSKDQIEWAAQQDTRIRFFGQVPRDEARRLQSQATVLVNPRTPAGEFTKYSFPSKTMEYMASGRPVLMHRLPGMPEDYVPYFIQPSEPTVESLATAMEDLAAWDTDRLATFGARSRAFVLREKNAVAQCRKIVDLILSTR
ncbi:glycosyltransferase [Chelativorans sp.]|uniref:glycosyltransferase n=1 Tax=Chelativorans sp. TaxID=2203393 RepID=UPI0028123258|nr:glycosyltransferase [Chelativorans sp.]